MNGLLPFVIAGLTTGSIYGLTALGLVLTYKTTGVFNFAHGTVAAASAYLFYELHGRRGLPWPIAGGLCLFVAAPLAGVAFEELARGLRRSPPWGKIVATVGLLLAIQGTIVVIYGPAQLTFPTFLPDRLYAIGGVNVRADQIIVVAFAALAAGALYGFFRFSRSGIAMRGVVDNPELLELANWDTIAVRRRAAIIGNLFAAVSGILLGPTIGLDPILLTLLVVQAFGAAAIGRFTSLPLTYLGGLLIGIGGAISTRYVSDVPALSGFPSSLPFLVLFAVLVLSRKGRLAELAVETNQAERRPAGRRRRSWPVLVLGTLVLVLIPFLVGAKLANYTNALIFAVMFVSLHLLVRTSGQISLCHAAFAAVGAVFFSHLTGGPGVPWLLALIGAGLAAVPVGVLVAGPAIRLSGLYLALATLGLGILMEGMLFSTRLMFGQGSVRFAPRPGIAGLHSDRGFYYVCLLTLVVVVLMISLVSRSRLGRLLRALADSPVALTTLGSSINVTRALVFSMSAFLAGIAGALLVAFSGSVSGAGFTPFHSLTWLAVLAISGGGEIASPLIAAFLLTLLPTLIQNQSYADLQPVLFGVAAIAAGLWGTRPSPIERWVRASMARNRGRNDRSPARERRAPLAAAAGESA
ncbi:MAG: hypothetical protein QOI86_175 [Actinomycetota bacterium]|nr:hypothetical protein [Actinomycetota bacterium]